MNNPLTALVAEMREFLSVIDTYKPIIGGAGINGTKLRSWADALDSLTRDEPDSEGAVPVAWRHVFFDADGFETVHYANKKEPQPWIDHWQAEVVPLYLHPRVTEVDEAAQSVVTGAMLCKALGIPNGDAVLIVAVENAGHDGPPVHGRWLAHIWAAAAHITAALSETQEKTR